MKSEREMDIRAFAEDKVKGWDALPGNPIARRFVEDFVQQTLEDDARRGLPTVTHTVDMDQELRLIVHEAGDLLDYEPCVEAECGCRLHESGRARRCKEHASSCGQ